MPNAVSGDDVARQGGRNIRTCEEDLLHAMVEQGLTLRQIVAIFRRFTRYCRCARRGRSESHATR